MASTNSAALAAAASAAGIPLQYAWFNKDGGRWVILNLSTGSLEVTYCGVSENPQSLPSPPTGYAISWISPSVTNEQALHRASHSDVYFVLCRSIGVKHEMDHEWSSESIAKKPKTDGYLAAEQDTHKKRRL